MNFKIERLIVPLLVSAIPIVCLAQAAPTITKVDPPSWWRNSSMNPVRLLIRGTDLKEAQVSVMGHGVRVIGLPKANDRGSYLFVDLAISPAARLGKKLIQVKTSAGAASIPFEVVDKPNPKVSFQGFSSDDVLYLVMIDRFADGDPGNDDPAESRGIFDRSNKFYYHGGDLQGIIDHLSYLKDLGVTAIWLTPWYDNYNGPNKIERKEEKPSTGFHGYNPQDFYKVEEHFGTLEKLQELVTLAHRSGIKIIQDEVVNHTGPYHPWVDDSPTSSWFNGTREHHLKNSFQTWVLHDPRPVQELKQETLEGWFLDFLPDLNQNDPEVEHYLIQNSLWWIGRTGLDGIRMDTWQYVPNSFWQKWTRSLKREFPHVTVVGEVKDGDVVHTSFFQGGSVRFDGYDSGLDSLLDFPLFYSIRHAFAEGKPLDEIPKTLAKDYLYTNPDVLVTLLGGHDDGRFMSEKGATVEGLKLANTFLLTTRGVPQLYYGDELAMIGADEPTTRADFPGGFPGDKRNAFTREGRTSEEQSLVQYVEFLTHLRAELVALRRGSLVNLYVAPQQYAYARKTKTSSVLIVINNDVKPAKLEIPTVEAGFADGVTLRDRLGQTTDVRVIDGKVLVNLPARSSAIFVRR